MANNTEAVNAGKAIIISDSEDIKKIQEHLKKREQEPETASPSLDEE